MKKDQNGGKKDKNAGRVLTLNVPLTEVFQNRCTLSKCILELGRRV